MSLWTILPYLERQVELGKMTREEADKQIRHIIEVDNAPEIIIRNTDTLDQDFEDEYDSSWEDEIYND